MFLRTLTFVLCALLSGVALAKRPKPDVGLCNEAIKVALDGDPAAAADLQQRCIEKVGSEGPEWLLYEALGDYRQAAGQHAEAVTTYERAMALGPKSAKLYVKRGRSNFELGRTDAARMDFESALGADPKAKEAHFGEAQRLEREGKRDEARAAFLRAFNFGERSPEMLRRVREYGFTVAEMPTRRDPPRMPRAAFRRCKPGKATLEITTDELGLVTDVTLQESSGHDDLDNAAIEAARQWNLQPTEKDGTYVGQAVVVPVNFTNPCQ